MLKFIKADDTGLKMNLQMFADPESTDGAKDNPETHEPQGDDSKGDDKSGESKEPKSFTQEELDNIVQREKAKALKQAEKLAEQKLQEKIDEAEKLKKMNADEQAEYKQQQLENELAELRKEKALTEMGKEAKTMLADKNVQFTDDVLSFVVNEDAEVTAENVKKFTAIIEAQREAIREEFTKKLGGRVPLGGSSDTPALSEAAKLAQSKNQLNKVKPDAPNPWGIN